MSDANNQMEEMEEKLSKAEKGKRISLVVGMGLGIVLGVTAAVLTVYEANKLEEVPVEEEVVEEVEIEPEYLDEPLVNIPGPLQDDRGNVFGYMFFDFKIEARNDDDVDFLEDRIPLLIEAFNKEMSMRSISMPGRPGSVDYDNLSKRLVSAANKALGRPAVLRIHIVKAIRGT